MGTVRTVEGAFGTDQLVTLQTEVYDLLILVDFAEISSYPLYSLGRSPSHLHQY